MILLVASIPGALAFAGGDGSVGNPFQISTCQELQDMNTSLGSNYILINDIDCDVAPFNTGSGFSPVGNLNPIGAFKGTLDGQGFNVTGFFINRPIMNFVGLFGITSAATIKNVGFVDVNVTSRDFTGSLIGLNSGGSTINNSFVTGSVRGRLRVGGLVGRFDGGTISNSHSTANIIGAAAGGLIGDMFGGNFNIFNSFATGSVDGSGRNNIGGLIGGIIVTGNISNSFATGNVRGANRVGGLIGNLGGGNHNIDASFATGNVSGSQDIIGGLVGRGSAGLKLSNSYATGNVAGRLAVGGLVGDNGVGGTISNSSATGSVSGSGSNVGGLAGLNGGTISNSSATGNVSSSGNNQATGGLVGRNRLNGNIATSFAIGNVNGKESVGGLAGFNGGTVTNSYATGNVSGSGSAVGGLVGDVDFATVTNSYATGSVSAVSSVGGLVGSLFGTLSNSYATGNVSGSGSDVGGLVGFNGGTLSNANWDEDRSGLSVCTGNAGTPSGCTGKNSGGIEPDYFFNVSNAPMTSWNFASIWDSQCSPEDGYPLLQGLAGQECIGGAPEPDTDGDGFTDIVDNCPADFNPDQSDLDSQDGGDVCDLCPDDASDTCDVSFSAGETVGSDGAIINNSAGEVTMDIPAGALSDNTSISLTKGGSNFQVLIPGRGGGTVLYEYTIGVPGTTFDQPVTITFTYDPEAGIPSVFKDEGAGFFDLGFDCTSTPGVCTGTVTSFSNFALIIVHDIFTGDAGECFNHDIRIGFFAEDIPVSCGLQGTLFCVDQTNTCIPNTLGNEVNITAEGTSYVRYLSVDDSGFGPGFYGFTHGNVENITTTIVRIDRFAPSEEIRFTAADTGTCQGLFTHNAVGYDPGSAVVQDGESVEVAGCLTLENLITDPAPSCGIVNSSIEIFSSGGRLLLSVPSPGPSVVDFDSLTPALFENETAEVTIVKFAIDAAGNNDTINITVILDEDGDGVPNNDDFCLGTNEGASIIPNGTFIGCTAGQLKADAVDEFRDLSSDLLQSGSEIGSGEVLDVLFLLVNAREGIVQDNFLFRTHPPESVVGDKKASADVDFELGRSFVKAGSGPFVNETIIASTNQTDIINAIIVFNLPGLTDTALIAELLEIREVKVLEGSEVFEFQHTSFEKLDGFKGKKIDSILISAIQDILANITFLQDKLVEDSGFLASTLLSNIDCSSITPGSAARTECDLGLSFLSEGDDILLPGPERIDFYRKAWLQGVKVLDELSIFTFGDVARRS